MEINYTFYFLDHLSQEIKLTNSSAVWRYLIGYKNLLRAIENLGIAVVYGIRYYGSFYESLKLIGIHLTHWNYLGQGNLTEDNYVQFIKHDTLSSAYLNQSINFVPYVRKNFEKIKKVTSDEWKDFIMKLIKFFTGRFWVLDLAEQ